MRGAVLMPLQVLPILLHQWDRLGTTLGNGEVNCDEENEEENYEDDDD